MHNKNKLTKLIFAQWTFIKKKKSKIIEKDNFMMDHTIMKTHTLAKKEIRNTSAQDLIMENENYYGLDKNLINK